MSKRVTVYAVFTADGDPIHNVWDYDKARLERLQSDRKAEGLAFSGEHIQNATTVVTYRYAYLDRYVTLCEKCAQKFHATLGPVSHSAHTGVCDCCSGRLNAAKTIKRTDINPTPPKEPIMDPNRLLKNKEKKIKPRSETYDIL